MAKASDTDLDLINADDAPDPIDADVVDSEVVDADVDDADLLDTDVRDAADLLDTDVRDAAVAEDDNPAPTDTNTATFGGFGGVPPVTEKPDAPDRTVFWAILGITALGLILRLWGLGDRAFHHDESLDAWFSHLWRNGDYAGYDPVYHGPLRFFITSWFFRIADNDSATTARMLSALSGSALVLLPYFVRHQLGRIGAIATAAALALSPSMLYFSRFGREDAQMMFLAGVMIVAVLGYLRRPSVAPPIIFMVALAASFTIKESAYLWFGMVGLFGLVVLTVQLESLARHGQRAAASSVLSTGGNGQPPAPVRDDEGDDASGEGETADPSILDFNFLLPLLALGGLLLATLTETVGLSVFASLGIFAAVMMTTAGVQLRKARNRGATLADVPILARLSQVGARPWVIGVAVFFLIFFTLFTSMWARPGDWHTGFTRAIEYWRSQQGENRGGQPWYYYLVTIPSYEWLFLILAAVGSVRAWKVRSFTLGFLTFLSVAHLILYSYAGERMPWLIVHPLLPILFLAGVGTQVLWENRNTGAVMAASGALALGFVFTVWTSVDASFISDSDARHHFVQAGQATDHVTLILDELEQLESLKLATTGQPLTVGLGLDDTWPWAFYLKDYGYQPWNPAEPAPDVDVLITSVYSGQAASVDPELGWFDTASMPEHTARPFALRVWWQPGLKDNSGSAVTYFDTGSDRLISRIGEWMKWVGTREAWQTIHDDKGPHYGCGSVDQWVMVRNSLIASVEASGSSLQPTFETLPCASPTHSVHPEVPPVG